MYGLSLIVSLVVLLFFISPFFILVRMRRLEEDLKDLQRQIIEIKLSKHSHETPEEIVEVSPGMVKTMPAVATNMLEVHQESIIPAPETHHQSDILSPQSNKKPWFGEDVLMKIGAVLILIALGWFMSYAFVHNWISPMNRILMGVAAGSALIGVGN